jgi:hypothetical protein
LPPQRNSLSRRYGSARIFERLRRIRNSFSKHQPGDRHIGNQRWVWKHRIWKHRRRLGQHRLWRRELRVGERKLREWFRQRWLRYREWERIERRQRFRQHRIREREFRVGERKLRKRFRYRREQRKRFESGGYPV